MDWSPTITLMLWLIFSGFVLTLLRQQLRNLVQELICLLRRVIGVTINQEGIAIKASDAISEQVRARLEQEGMARLDKILQNAGIDAVRFPIEFLLPEYVVNDLRWPEKVAIGFYVSHHLLDHTKGIILDTGSTVAAVSAVLMTRAAKPEIIITNSLSTASFICRCRNPHKQPQILVPGGIVRSDFRGCYWDSDDIKSKKLRGAISGGIDELIRDVRKSLGELTCIISATDFSARHGPGANSLENQLWKKHACLIADRVIICVDVDKIEHGGVGVFGSPSDWEDILRTKDVSIVVCGSPNEPKKGIVNSEIEFLCQMEDKFQKTLLHHGLESNERWEFKHRCLKNGLFSDEFIPLNFGSKLR